MERKIRKSVRSSSLGAFARHSLLSGADRGFLTSWISNPERVDRSAGGDTLRERRMFAERMHRYQREPIQAIRADICLPGTTSRVQLTLASGAIPYGAGLTSNGLLSLPVPSGPCSRKIAPADLAQIFGALAMCQGTEGGFRA